MTVRAWMRSNRTLILIVATVMITMGIFLIWQGLDRADKWSSVFGAFLNLVAVGLAVYAFLNPKESPQNELGDRKMSRTSSDGEHQANVTNSISGIVGGSAVQARDIHIRHGRPGPKSKSPEDGETDSKG